MINYNEQFLYYITKDLEKKEDNSSNANTLKDVLKVFNAYPSVRRIRRNIEINLNFSFQQVTEDLVRKIVLKLDSLNATPVVDISVDVLKSTADIHLLFITKIIKLSFENNRFLDDLKLAEVSPVFKKRDHLDKEN